MLDSGEHAEAQAPVVVSASRSTDIPAFYAEWFFERLRRGYSAWTNPFNGVRSYVAYCNTRFIVFWSKNPRPLLEHLDYLAERGIGCYVQYTLNEYEREGLERGVPPLSQRIDTFHQLAERLGVGHVVWRFDPMILTDRIGIDDLLEKVAGIGNRLVGYTEKLVFSFADISTYRKVKSNLDAGGIHYLEWDESLMQDFASRLAAMNRERGWNFELATCAEKIDLSQYGIAHNRCVDDRLIIRLAYTDRALMDYLGVDIRRIEPQGRSLFEEYAEPKALPADAIVLTPELYAVKKRSNRDAGQRALCGCTVSKDIGQYNTCPHLCEYCYANASKAIAVASLPELVYTGITRAKENLPVINIGSQQYHDFFEAAAR